LSKPLFFTVPFPSVIQDEGAGCRHLWIAAVYIIDIVGWRRASSTSQLASFWEKFSTPLQINHYAWSSLIKAHQIGQKPADIEVLNDVISKDLDRIEATLRRYGYDIKALSEAVDARPTKIRIYFKGWLSSGHATEIQKEILKLGIVGL